MKSHYISVNGIKARYIDEGEGDQTLVFVHGLAGSVDYWEKNIPYFSKKVRVIALDLVGCGKTDKPKLKYKNEMFINFLKNFLDLLNIKKCILVGHSMGGGICLQIAVDFPGYVEQLILVSSAGFYKKLPLPYRLASLPFLSKFLLKARSPDIMAAMIRYFAYEKNAISDDFVDRASDYWHSDGAINAMRGTVSQNVNFRGIKKSLIKKIKQKALQLKVPVTVIWGKDDNLLSLKGAEMAKQLMPHAKVYLLDHCGHMPQLEHPEEFNRIVDELFTK